MVRPVFPLDGLTFPGLIRRPVRCQFGRIRLAGLSPIPTETGFAVGNAAGIAFSASSGGRPSAFGRPAASAAGPNAGIRKGSGLRRVRVSGNFRSGSGSRASVIPASSRSSCPARVCGEFLRVPRLLANLRIAHGEGTISKFCHDLAKLDLLVLDDRLVHGTIRFELRGASLRADNSGSGKLAPRGPRRAQAVDLIRGPLTRRVAPSAPRAGGGSASFRYRGFIAALSGVHASRKSGDKRGVQQQLRRDGSGPDMEEDT